MSTNLKFFIYTLLTCSILVACAGEDGEPGPAGEIGGLGEKGEQGPAGTNGNDSYKKLGYFEGIVTGIRKDGTPLNEAFKYEYTSDSIQTFFEENSVKHIYLNRSMNPFGEAYLNLNLKAETEGILLPSVSSSSIYFRFLKELDPDNLFTIYASPYFESTQAVTREISAEKNQIYRFSNDGPLGKIFYYSEDSYNFNEPSFVFYSYVNNENLNIYYSVSNGQCLGVRTNNTGQILTSGALFNLYNKLKFKFSQTYDVHVFYDAATDLVLAEAIPDVPADQLNITNYLRNTSTGVVTFDYEIKISGIISNLYYRQNTTRHDLTIKGKFNSGGKVYKNSVGRLKG